MMTEAQYLEAAKSAKNLLVHRGNTPEDAEDAVQDAALNVLTTKHPWNGTAPFKTWFCSVAINARLMAMRGAMAKALRDSMPVDPDMLVGQSTPESLYSRDERIGQIMLAATTLPPSQYRAFFARYGMDMTLDDTAELLGIHVGTVKSTLHCARRKIVAQCSNRPH